jgi:hypothetical protein
MFTNNNQDDSHFKQRKQLINEPESEPPYLMSSKPN